MEVIKIKKKIIRNQIRKKIYKIKIEKKKKYKIKNNLIDLFDIYILYKPDIYVINILKTITKDYQVWVNYF